MIRKLMAGSAFAALMATGAFNLALAQTDTTAPAMQQDTTSAATTDMVAGESEATLTPDEPTIASAFMGREVYSSNTPDSNSIGEVNDLIIGSDGMITHAVVGVGGFLGIGEKDVAVPFDELQVIEDQANGNIRLIYSATREQLEAAEAFDRTAYDPRARAADQQAATDTGAAMVPAGGLAPATNAMAPDATTPNNMAATDATTTSTMAAADSATPPAPSMPLGEATYVSFAPDQLRASNMMGQNIYGPDDSSIGEVADLVFDKAGNTRSALLDVGGFLGIGEKRVAIPFKDIKMVPEANAEGQADASNNEAVRLTTAMTREQLEALPAWEAPAAMAAAPAPAAVTTDAGQSAMAPATGDSAMVPATGEGAANYEMVSQDMTADDLIGTAVYGPNDESIGEVGDVVFNPNGDIEAAIIDVGGFLGVGEKAVAVQFSALNMRRDENGDIRLVVNATQDQLQNAPAYNADAAAGQPTTTVQ